MIMLAMRPMYLTARNQQVLGRSFDDQTYFTSDPRVRRWSYIKIAEGVGKCFGAESEEESTRLVQRERRICISD